MGCVGGTLPITIDEDYEVFVRRDLLFRSKITLVKQTRGEMAIDRSLLGTIAEFTNNYVPAGRLLHHAG